MTMPDDDDPEGVQHLDPKDLPPVDDEDVRRAEERAQSANGRATEAGGRGMSEKQPKPPRARDVLIGIADELAELWRDEDGRAFATVPVGDHRENHRVASRQFRQWLTALYADRNPRVLDTGKIVRAGPNAHALQEAIDTITSIAARGPVRTPAVRLAADAGGDIWLDLGDPSWRVVRIAPKGWTIEPMAAVPFIRSDGLRALPVPRDGGSIAELAGFVNVEGGAEGEDFRLIVAWLVMALRPSGPYPILFLNGEQGSAKSSATKALRALIDPNLADTRSLGRDDEALQLAARNGWICAFDNLSSIRDEMADALCRLSTGAAMAKRRLYTDADEELFSACRPIVANGIPALATRGDLADRAMVVILPVIASTRRRDEGTFWPAFEAARPRLLGALLDAACCALRRHSAVKLDRLPRMADFAVWVEAAAPALGWPAGTFLEAFEANRRGAVQDVLEADKVAAAVLALIEREGSWSGTSTELLAKIDEAATETQRKAKGWPRDATRMSGMLRRAAPALRQAGLTVEMSRKSDRTRGKLIQLGRDPQTKKSTASEAFTASAATETTVGNEGNHREARGNGTVSPAPDARSLSDAVDAPPGSEPTASGPWRARVRVVRT
jgi:hypothetical protein